MPTVASLHLYPVKGMGGISLDASPVEARGLRHDRRWMLVDGNGRFLSQRAIPAMCLFRPEMREDSMRIAGPDGSTVDVPLGSEGERLTVQVWASYCDAIRVPPFVDEWFSERMEMPVRMVYMPDDSIRPTHPDFTRPGDKVGFADAMPVLVASRASLDSLNARLAEPLPMNRFRPNIVVEGVSAHEEDAWPGFELSGVRFRAAKKCGRCQVTTTNQETAEVGIEPLRTLANYRLEGNAVYFGAYFVPEGEGVVSVGDALVFS
ncbi:MOSC domain-containing protein [Fimbriimonas ginsengisoli]|uniref:MOSC N-terminal beta barrel domain family n=1 Tax=Fimbriimonas ginsengisoli Gsoil 348 TaxID=661478 RepID=A0A068NKY5_FIMGI|nr:MOSC N-terminal beta barrel domain-containing protein [Fimbriimonas ginsengisoli]AIE84136.1 MOSC N-terminal beta barrel domain family [Fimbriimonas ginsengisoli Gsoil 348]